MSATPAFDTPNKDVQRAQAPAPVLELPSTAELAGLRATVAIPGRAWPGRASNTGADAPPPLGDGADRLAFAGGHVLRRRIDPELPAGNGLAAAAYRSFAQKNIKPEFDRVTEDEAQAVVPQGSTKADLTQLATTYRATLQAFQGGNATEVDVRRDMQTLVTAINAAADAIEQGKHAEYTQHFSVRNQQLGPEDNLRWERTRREGVMVPAGGTKVNLIRGFRSAQEAETIITGLRDALRQAGMADVQVAARGSAVRGTNRDNTRAYRPGTAMADKANDASDVDFFFFSTVLEKMVNQMAEEGHPSWRTGGNIHPDDLVLILKHGDCTKRLQRAGIDRDALLQAIATFPTQTKQTLGRKSDVTLLKLAELQNFQPNEYVLL